MKTKHDNLENILSCLIVTQSEFLDSLNVMYNTFIVCLFVTWLIYLFAKKTTESFNTHNSEFVPKSGIFNDTTKKLKKFFNIKLSKKPKVNKTFADSIGFIKKQSITPYERNQIILWIQENINLKFIKFNALRKEKDIIYTEFYMSIDDPVYYVLVLGEIQLKPTTKIFKLDIMGLVTKFDVASKESRPKIKLHDSFIDAPDVLTKTEIFNILQQFELNKKEIQLRNKNVI